MCRVFKYLLFVAATAIISPAMAQNSKSCQSFVGVWTYTQQGFSGDFVIEANGSGRLKGLFGFPTNGTWTCAGSQFAFDYGLGVVRMRVSADGMRMAGTAGSLVNASITAVRKSKPPAVVAAALPSNAPSAARVAALPVGRAAAPPVVIPAAASAADAAKLLQPQLNESPRGVYKLDREYDFNVLDAVYYDTATRQVSLVGHHDERFKGPRIPYLQHLATLLEVTKPQFTLNMTPDALRRVDSFLKMSLSPQQSDKISTQLGAVMDAAGKVTSIGRYMLPAIGVYPTPDNRAPGYFGADTRLSADGKTLVSRLVPNSPAAQTSLAPGDRILFFNEQFIYLPSTLAREVRIAGAGSTVKLAFLREKRVFNEVVTLAPDPKGDPWSALNRYDVIASLYRGAGNEEAARVVDAMSLMNDTPIDNPALLAAWRNFTASVNLADEAKEVLAAQRTGGPAYATLAMALGQNVSRRLDEIFEFPGQPVRAAYNANVARTQDPGPGIKAALSRFDVALKPKIGELLDRAFNRPEGIQIPPELIENLFHVGAEMTPDYLGVPPTSLLARAMFDGDYLTKGLVNRPDLKLRIPAYQTSFEFKQTHPEFRRSESTWRIWISVAKLDAAQSQAGDTLQFRDVQMRFNIRELGKDGADLPNQPGGYEELLTSLYDDFAIEYPTLHELREAAKLSAAAAWLRTKTPSLRLPKEGGVVWRGPSKVPGLMYAYLAPGGGKTKVTLIATGGVSLEPFPRGAPSLFPVDSSVVDLRGLAAGGPMPCGAPLAPLDSSIVDLRQPPPCNPLTRAPDVYRKGALSGILGKAVDVVQPTPVGWTEQVEEGQRTFQSISLVINSLGLADAERALELRNRLEKARRLALQLWIVERAKRILTQGASDWAQQFQSLQTELINAKWSLKLLTDVRIESLAGGTAERNALVAELVRLQKEVAGQLELALDDPLLKLGQPDAPAAGRVPAATAKPWTCAGADTFCIPGNAGTPAMALAPSSGSQTSYATASAQLQAMVRDPAKAANPQDVTCVSEGKIYCKTAEPIKFPKFDQGRPRGSAAVSPDVLERMKATQKGKELTEREHALSEQIKKIDETAYPDERAREEARKGLAEELANTQAEIEEESSHFHMDLSETPRPSAGPADTLAGPKPVSTGALPATEPQTQASPAVTATPAEPRPMTTGGLPAAEPEVRSATPVVAPAKDASEKKDTKAAAKKPVAKDAWGTREVFGR